MGPVLRREVEEREQLQAKCQAKYPKACECLAKDREEEQRCTVQKTANVLDKLPKSVQPKAKADLNEIWQALTRAAGHEKGTLLIIGRGAWVAGTWLSEPANISDVPFSSPTPTAMARWIRPRGTLMMAMTSPSR